MNSRDAVMVLVALAVEAFKWAVVIGAFLLVLYFLVRFVKWAWTDKPEPKDDPAKRSYQQYVGDAAGRLQEIASVDPDVPLTTDQWGEFLDIASGHDKQGRPICMKCGVPIPEGKSVLLTDKEKEALARRRGVKVESLPGAFRHMNEAECERG